MYLIFKFRQNLLEIDMLRTNDLLIYKIWSALCTLWYFNCLCICVCLLMMDAHILNQSFLYVFWSSCTIISNCIDLRTSLEMICNCSWFLNHGYFRSTDPPWFSLELHCMLRVKSIMAMCHVFHLNSAHWKFLIDELVRRLIDGSCRSIEFW